MSILILGLVLFLGAHLLPTFAAGFRARQIARIGLGPWKGVHSAVSVIGFALIIWGFGIARDNPLTVYEPAPWLRHVTALLTLVTFLLIVATYVPRNSFRALVGHPLSLSVVSWATGHLLANGRVADILLFGGFLVWSAISFANSRRKDRKAGTAYPPGTLRGTAIVLIVGLIAWAVFALWLHVWLFGVSPMA
jgi:uncharacterized membrane protein